MTSIVSLDEEYRSTRAALVNAGLDMTDSMDALYRDWRRRRAKSESRARVDNTALRQADEWWTHHLAQFRSLIDPLHVAARAGRARKDRNEEARAKRHPARNGRSADVLIDTAR
jgi:hypothetical protein